MVDVLVIDDQPTFREAAREVVEATDDFILVSEANSRTAALEAVAAKRPDLVLVNVRMAGREGIDTARRVHAYLPQAVVVLVSAEDPLRVSAEVATCGAAELVRKQDLRPALLQRIWLAHRPR